MASWKMEEVPLVRGDRQPLLEQISQRIEMAIVGGSLRPGGRLPSWCDLAAQLGVARGTVRAAYQRLIDKDLLVTAGSAGTRVADPLPPMFTPVVSNPDDLLPPDFYRRSEENLVFQMGVPARDAFPAKTWSRLHRQAAQDTSMRTNYCDPRGLAELRSAVASHVAIARGIECSPEQIIITTGFRGGLAMALRAIRASGRRAWVEDPGYPATRLAVEYSGLKPIAIPIDKDGLNVEVARYLAPEAAVAIVTPGQQVPSGVTLAHHRRKELIQWANETQAWIIEDDYLAELQLSGRRTLALASGAGADRVIHIGSFSVTISPALGIGFLVTPLSLARRSIDVATWLRASPNPALQLALARFMQEGHYLRHLRRMRRLYQHRRQALLNTLIHLGVEGSTPAGLSVLLPLPEGFDDQGLVVEMRSSGLGPVELSRWFSAAPRARAGLLLGIANVLDEKVEQDCRRLLALIGPTIGSSARATFF